MSDRVYGFKENKSKAEVITPERLGAAQPVEGSLLTFAENCDAGLTIFTTDLINTDDSPHTYGIGYVMKTLENEIVVGVFDIFGSAPLFANKYSASANWSDWSTEFLPLAGGTLEGSRLGLADNMGAVSASDSSAMISSHGANGDTENYRGLAVGTTGAFDALADAVKLAVVINGVLTQYRMYGAHNFAPVNNLTSESSTLPLAAAQGKALADRFNLSATVAAVRNAIDTTVERCKIQGYVSTAGYPYMQYVHYPAGSTTSEDYVGVYFDGTNFYAEGKKDGGSIVKKKLGELSSVEYIGTCIPANTSDGTEITVEADYQAVVVIVSNSESATVGTAYPYNFTLNDDAACALCIAQGTAGIIDATSTTSYKMFAKVFLNVKAGDVLWGKRNSNYGVRMDVIGLK